MPMRKVPTPRPTRAEVDEIISALEENIDIQYVYHASTGRRAEPAELWIPDLGQWLRLSDMMFKAPRIGSSVGGSHYEYNRSVYPTWWQRFRLRRACYRWEAKQ